MEDLSKINVRQIGAFGIEKQDSLKLKHGSLVPKLKLEKEIITMQFSVTAG